MYVSTIGTALESVNYSKLNEKTSLSTSRLEYFIETFRALGVARGHSNYKLTK